MRTVTVIYKKYTILNKLKDKQRKIFVSISQKFKDKDYKKKDLQYFINALLYFGTN